MKKKTVITTEKREVWVIREGADISESVDSDRNPESNPESIVALPVNSHVTRDDKNDLTDELPSGEKKE